MADREGQALGENSRQFGPPSVTPSRADDGKDENVVSSSTPMETESVIDEEHMGTESLPQTYLATPVVSHCGQLEGEALPLTSMGTSFATVSQSEYVNSEVPMIHSLAGQQSYLGTDATSAPVMSERLIYISGGVSSHVNPLMLSQAGYTIVSEPLDVSRNNIAHAHDVSRISTAELDINRGTDSHVIGVNIHNSGAISRVTLPETSDLGPISMSQSIDVTKANTHLTSDVSRPNETGDVSSLLNISATSGVNRMRVPKITDGSRIGLMQTSDFGRDRRVDTTQAIGISRIAAPIGADVRVVALKYDESVESKCGISLVSGDSNRVQASDLSRVNLSQVHNLNRENTDQAVDTKPIILPSADDVGIVILPQTGDVGTMDLPHNVDVNTGMNVSFSGEVGGIQTDDVRIHQSGNVFRISLPMTEDQGQLPIPQSASVSVPQHSEMGIVQLPQTVDMNRLMIPQTSDVGSAKLQQTPDSSQLIVSQTGHVSSIEALQKPNLRRLIAYQNSVDTRVFPAEGHPAKVQQKPDVGGMSAHRTDSSVSKMIGHNTFTSKAHEMLEKSDLSRMSVHHQVIGSSRENVPSTTNDVSMLRMAPVTDTSRMSTQQTNSVNRMNVSSPGLVSGMSLRQVDNTKMNVSQPGVRVGTPHVDTFIQGRPQHVDNVNRMTGHPVNDVSGMNVPSMNEMNLARMRDTGPTSRVQIMHKSNNEASVPQTGISTARIDTADINRMKASLYTDPNATTLPQTSDVRSVSTPHSDAAAATGDDGTLQQVTSVDNSRMTEQQNAEYIKMRMMAEAAEIMSRSNVPADDINMRLMAETADYVSRNVPQTVVVSTGTSGSSAESGNSGNTKIVSQAGGSSTRQKDVAPGLKLTAKDASQLNYSRGAAVNMITAGASHSCQLPFKKSAVIEKDKEISENRIQTDNHIVPGFRAEFMKSESYRQWKDIGINQGLRSDEEIACFLIKYYGNTSKLFPSGSSVCNKCHQQFTISCGGGCQQETADSGDARRQLEDNSSGKQEGSDERTRLWKLIVEAGSKEKEEEDSKNKERRRKPKKTQRVLRKRGRQTTKSSDDSQDEKDSPERSSESELPAKVHFEEQQKATPSSQIVTRKRGRPSNDSYHKASTLECPGCKRKFHTNVGLDQHIKLKRCKAAQSGTATPKEESKKKSDKTRTPALFKCDDCDKEYRSKQGLMLHRISKHDEVSNDKDQSVSSGDNPDDDGEDTDEYTPYPKDKSPVKFECPDCHKVYRSKQGMLLHKASKHDESQEKRIKLEGSGGEAKREASETEKEGLKTESLSLECKECNKKYTSRPGYVLHMKTKHSPQVFMECSECKAEFKTKVELRIHIRRDHHKGKLVLFCPYCPKIFHDREVLKTHMDSNHKTCRRVLFDCFACELQFSSRIERKRHIQSEHKGKDTSLTCHFCGNWFATRFEYDQHEKEGHPDQNQSWLCATCGDSFPTRYLLQRHTLCHKEKIHCDLCNKSITEPCFEDHMKRHFGNKTWKCELCSKAFIRKAELQQHTLVHKDERPFCCELCGMRYREKSRLNSHMRTHTGQKPYQCQQCNKCFTRSRELKNHMRVHTGEKPFCCTVCGRKFASSGNLSAHRRKVHKLDPIPHGQQSRKHTLEEKIKPENTVPLPPLVSLPVAVESPMTHGTVSVEVPVAHSTTTFEVPIAHSSTVQEVPAAHTSSLAHQAAPMAHQAPVAHQDSTVVFQQHLIPKYEPVVSKSEHYIPQPVIQQSQPSIQVFWPNSSFGEES